MTSDVPAVLADGVSTATITVTTLDLDGVPMAGLVVSLAATGTGNVLSRDGDYSDAQGKVQVTLSSTTVEKKVVSASVSRGMQVITIVQTAEVEFTAGAVDPARSTLAVSRTQAFADGQDGITVTAVLRDAWDHLVQGAQVLFTSSLEGSVVTPDTVTSDHDGGAAALVTSTAMGPTTLAAHVGDGGVSATVDVTFQEPPDAGPCAPGNPASIPVPALRPDDGGYTLVLVDSAVRHYQGTIRAHQEDGNWWPMVADLLVCTGEYLDPKVQVALSPSHSWSWTCPTCTANPTGEIYALYAVPASDGVRQRLHDELADVPVDVWGFEVEKVVYDSDGHWVSGNAQAIFTLVTHVCFH